MVDGENIIFNFCQPCQPINKYKCLHNRRKYYCKDCGGSAFCQHNRLKCICKECKGGSICKHNKRKSRCKDCGGSEICEHNRQKIKCKECGGNAICKHNVLKYYCKECGGSVFCEHNKLKYSCNLCNGSAICEHNIRKTRCKECGGSELCKSSWCESSGNPKYDRYCLPCYVNLFPDKPNARNYKTKEKSVTDYITKIFANFTWICDRRIQDGCSRRRPDLLLDMGTHIIIVEIDENKHSDYDCSCENKRLMELSQDLQHRPIVFIRFNPDDYNNKDGILVKSCWKLNKFGVIQLIKFKEWEERLESLKSQIQYWIDNPTEKTVEIIELFY